MNVTVMQFGRPPYSYFTLSFVFHILLFIILGKFDLFFNPEEISKDPVSIDFISNLQKPSAFNTQNKKNINKDLSEQTMNSPKADPIDEMSTLDGESEIGSDPNARPPKSETEKYLVLLKSRVNEFQKYPRQSKVFKEEGLVKIRMTINRDGQLTKLELVQSSGHSRLNDAAMKAVSDAAPFSKFPDEVTFQTWKIIVPIRFVL
jgi:TonB family protein